MKAKIAAKEEIAQGTLLVTYDLLGQDVDFKPGQYFFVNLIDPPYDGDRIRHHFSIVNSPNEKGVLKMATRLRDTPYKKSLQEIPVGSEVELGPVVGQFVLPEDESRHVVFIAGGIGITPFMSMLSYIKEEGLGYTVTLLYANKTREQTAFFDDLKKLEDEMPSFHLVITMDHQPDWSGETRLIDADFIKDYVPDYMESLFMVAGPPGMDKAMVNALDEAGVPEESVRTERFTGY